MSSMCTEAEWNTLDHLALSTHVPLTVLAMKDIFRNCAMVLVTFKTIHRAELGGDEDVAVFD